MYLRFPISRTNLRNLNIAFCVSLHCTYLCLPVSRTNLRTLIIISSLPHSTVPLSSYLAAPSSFLSFSQTLEPQTQRPLQPPASLLLISHQNLRIVIITSPLHHSTVPLPSYPTGPYSLSHPHELKGSRHSLLYSLQLAFPILHTPRRIVIIISTSLFLSHCLLLPPHRPKHPHNILFYSLRPSFSSPLSQGEEITHNVSAGIIQSNQSLVLQRLTKTSSGQYTCAASNTHGRSSSNAVQLSVKCECELLRVGGSCERERVRWSGA